MKSKRIMTFLIGIVVNIIFLNSISFADFSDIKSNKYKVSISKMEDLEILNGITENKFMPSGKVTREQFAAIIIRALDFGDDLNNQKSVFPDIETTRWSAGYINEAYNRKFITGKTDGLFYPEENITFGQVCTILVKILGYTDDDLVGVWPNNYVNKASDLDITKDLNIDPFSSVRRDQMAKIIDNFLNTKIKNGDVTVANRYGIYMEDIVIGNSITNDTLKDNQIITANNGILDNKSDNKDLSLGEKYDFVLEDGVIVKSIKLDNKVEKFNVINYKDGKVSDKNGEIVLSTKDTYYNNGVKISFDKLYEVLKINSSLIFLYNNTNKIEVEAVTVVDPIYSKPIIVGNKKYSLKRGYSILKDGKYIKESDIEERDVIYRVDSYLNNSSYYEVVQNSVQGELTGISRNKVAAFSLEIDGVSYPISKYMPLEKLMDNKGYTISDKVCAILGYDGKVIDLMDKGIKNGKYQKIRILGDSRSINTLERNEVLTSSGTYYVLDGLGELPLGAKCEVVIDNDTIVKVGEKEQNQIGVTVRNVDENKITYDDGEIMLLPSSATYYYNGAVYKCEDIQQKLKYNSSIIFIYNENKTGYESAIVIDPIYSKPEFVMGFNAYQKLRVGDINFTRDIPVIIGNETTDIYDIDNDTVMYKVSNYWDKNEYLLILDAKVDGTIEEFIPSRLNINSIKINEEGEYKTYMFSEYFDINTLTNNRKLNQYKKGSLVKLYLDKDGKIFHIG